MVDSWGIIPSLGIIRAVERSGVHIIGIRRWWWRARIEKVEFQSSFVGSLVAHAGMARFDDNEERERNRLDARHGGTKKQLDALLT